MWETSVSFPFTTIANPQLRVPITTKRTNYKPLQQQQLRIRASDSQYPLASRILVKNIPYFTSERVLEEEFSNFGQIAEVKLIKDEATKRSKGYAFIQYTSQDDAMLALENMDCKVVDGRTISVELAKPLKGFGQYPKASGPPKIRPKRQSVDQQGEEADCWY